MKERAVFVGWNWVLELVVERLRLVAVDVINNLAHGIVNSFRSVGDVVVGHVRPGVPEAKGNSLARYLKFCADRGEGVPSGVHRHAFRYRMPDDLAQPLEVYVEGVGNLCKVIIRKLNFARQTLVKV